MPAPPFHSVPGNSVVEEIIEQIKDLIHSERYAPSARLPSERDLAKQLKVSRPSVREALRTLTLMGVVDTRHGSGTQIAASSARVLKTPFEFLLSLDRPSMEELLEARELLEVFLAGRAAERRTQEDLGAIQRALDDMRRALPRRAQVLEP